MILWILGVLRAVPHLGSEHTSNPRRPWSRDPRYHRVAKVDWISHPIFNNHNFLRNSNGKKLPKASFGGNLQLLVLAFWLGYYNLLRKPPPKTTTTTGCQLQLTTRPPETPAFLGTFTSRQLHLPSGEAAPPRLTSSDRTGETAANQTASGGGIFDQYTPEN